MVCAEERIAPRNEYLELDAQPAMITPYTESEVIIRIYSRPTLILVSSHFSEKGITAQAANDGASDIIGPI